METHRSFSRRVASLGVLLLAGAGSSSSAEAARQASTVASAVGRAAAHAHAHLGSLASDLNECSAQAGTCLDDVECLECMTSYVDHPVEYDECMGNYEPDWPSATACDVKAAQPCCFDLVSRGNCLESGYFLEYWGCWFEEFAACPDYELTCIGNAETSESISSASADGVVEEGEEAASVEESGAAAGIAPSRTQAVAAVASSVAGVAAAVTLLLV